jgi:mannosyl-oligosaccharide glucosidase
MISGTMLSTRLESKQKDFEERYNKVFNVNDKVISSG